jgi:hypothetical protein
MTRKPTPEEYEFLQRVLRAVDAGWKDLSPWERDFLETTIERVNQFKENIKLSDKQWQVIADIAEKIL